MSFRQHDVIPSPAVMIAPPHLMPGVEKIVDLPVPLTRLVGRGDQLAAIDALYRDSVARLVTLTGPGGIGKTRLAIAVAHSLVDRFDRLHFVPLVGVADHTQVADAIAQRLGVREPPGGTIEAALRETLRLRRTLLVLDNMEHLVDASALVVQLLWQCPDLHVLVTSRAPLGVAGEIVRVVPALTLPDPEQVLAGTDPGSHEATSLFLDRVRAFQPEFVVDVARASDIAAVCVRLDGLPLAIELAAARIRVLTPAALRERLGRALDVLTGGGLDHAAHQQTMRGTIAWSVGLLAPDERLLFQRLGVTAGGFDIEAVEVLAAGISTGSSLDTLAGLVNQSLVLRDRFPVDSHRFRMLATIREYALDMLDASDDARSTRARFADHVRAVTLEATSHLNGLDQVAWARRLDAEQPNIQATLQWLEQTGDRDALLEMLVALQPYWLMRGQFDVGSARMRTGVDIAERTATVAPHLRGDMFVAAGRLELGRGNREAAHLLGVRALAVASVGASQLTIAHATELLGLVAYRATDYDRAAEYLKQSHQLYEDLGDREGVARSLHGLATTRMDAGDLAVAEALFSRARSAFEQRGNASGAAMAIDNLGVALYSQGEVQQAEALAEQALEVFRRIGDVRRTAVALDHVGKCTRRRGDLDRAWLMHRESLEIRIRIGDPRGMAVWLEAMAALLAEGGNAIPAARLLGATAALRQERSLPLHGNETIEHDQVAAQLEGDLNRTGFDEAFEQGRRLSLDEAVALAVLTVESIPSDDAGSDPLAPYRLTPRETEILKLLTERMSDRDISEALFISPRTVARHLAGIFAKLDVHSRREAADLARSIGAFAKD